MAREGARVVSDVATDRDESHREPDGARTVASKVHGFKVAAGALEQLPRLTVRFWDGSTVAARNDPDAPVVLIRDEQAIAHFLHSPNQLGLSRAWVSGALDVDGDLEKVLDLRHQVRDFSLGPMGRVRPMGAALRVAGARALRRPPIPRSEAQPAGRLHSLRRDKAAVTHHYDALTLRRWVANLAAGRERVWRLYMLGSAQGFEGGEIGIYQTLAARDGAEHGLPLDRSHLQLTSARAG